MRHFISVFLFCFSLSFGVADPVYFTELFSGDNSLNLNLVEKYLELSPQEFKEIDIQALSKKEQKAFLFILDSKLLLFDGLELQMGISRVMTGRDSQRFYRIWNALKETHIFSFDSEESLPLSRAKLREILKIKGINYFDSEFHLLKSSRTTSSRYISVVRWMLFDRLKEFGLAPLFKLIKKEGTVSLGSKVFNYLLSSKKITPKKMDDFLLKELLGVIRFHGFSVDKKDKSHLMMTSRLLSAFLSIKSYEGKASKTAGNLAKYLFALLKPRFENRRSDLFNPFSMFFDNTGLKYRSSKTRHERFGGVEFRGIEQFEESLSFEERSSFYEWFEASLINSANYDLSTLEYMSLFFRKTPKILEKIDNEILLLLIDGNIKNNDVHLNEQLPTSYRMLREKPQKYVLSFIENSKRGRFTSKKLVPLRRKIEKGELNHPLKLKKELEVFIGKGAQIFGEDIINQYAEALITQFFEQKNILSVARWEYIEEIQTTQISERLKKKLYLSCFREAILFLKAQPGFNTEKKLNRAAPYIRMLSKSFEKIKVNYKEMGEKERKRTLSLVSLAAELIPKLSEDTLGFSIGQSFLEILEEILLFTLDFEKDLSVKNLSTIFTNTLSSTSAVYQKDSFKNKILKEGDSFQGRVNRLRNLFFDKIYENSLWEEGLLVSEKDVIENEKYTIKILESLSPLILTGLELFQEIGLGNSSKMGKVVPFKELVKWGETPSKKGFVYFKIFSLIGDYIALQEKLLFYLKSISKKSSIKRKLKHVVSTKEDKVNVSLEILLIYKLELAAEYLDQNFNTAGDDQDFIYSWQYNKKISSEVSFLDKDRLRMYFEFLAISNSVVNDKYYPNIYIENKKKYLLGYERFLKKYLSKNFDNFQRYIKDFESLEEDSRGFYCSGFLN